MLNSDEHGILNARKFKYIKKCSMFLVSDEPITLFFLFINVKMPTVVGILTFMSRKHLCSAELSMKKGLSVWD